MLDIIPSDELELLYSNNIRFEAIESAFPSLETKTQDSILLLRFARYKLRKAHKYEDQFRTTEFATILEESGLSNEVASQLEVCFESFFSIDEYISAHRLEELELFLVKKDIMETALQNR